MVLALKRGAQQREQELATFFGCVKSGAVGVLPLLLDECVDVDAVDPSEDVSAQETAMREKRVSE